MTDKKKLGQTEQYEQNSSIQLLQIICMFTVIVHHCIVHGGSLYLAFSCNRIIAEFLVPMGKIGFTCFLPIITWSLVDMQFKAKHFLSNWLGAFFYSVTLAAISLCITGTFTWKGFFAAFLPIAGNSQGFVSSYLLLYLFVPYLQKVMIGTSKYQARLLLILLFYAQILSQIIGQINGHKQSLASEFMLFIFCFVLTFNLKHWPVQIIHDKVLMGLFVSFIYFLIVALAYLRLIGCNYPIVVFFNDITYNESSLLYLLAGYCLFFFAKDIKICENAYINKIASLSFGILLIHDNNYFRYILWDDIVKCSRWILLSFYFLRILLYSISVFIFCAVIDYLRKYVLEERILNLDAFQEICVKFDKKYVCQKISGEE